MVTSHSNQAKNLIRWPLPQLGMEKDDDLDTELIPFILGKSTLTENEIIGIALALSEYTPPTVRQ